MAYKINLLRSAFFASDADRARMNGGRSAERAVGQSQFLAADVSADRSERPEFILGSRLLSLYSKLSPRIARREWAHVT